MATRSKVPSVSETDFLFAQIRKKIEDTFDSLLYLVNQRKDRLLAELEAIQSEHTNRSVRAQSSLDKLEKDSEDMRQLSVSVKADVAREGLRKTIEEITQRIQEEETNMFSPDISFVCETNDLEWRISHIGSLSRVSVQNSLVRRYTEIRQPLKKFVKETGQTTNPRGLYVDNTNERIIISEISNSEIEIWSFEGEMIKSFGKEELESPWELCLTDDCLFVTDIHLDAVIKFDIERCAFLARTEVRRGSEPGELASPAGIDTGEDQLFVMECDNKRISVFDLNLNFKRTIGCGLIDKAHALRVEQCTVYLMEDSGVLKLFSAQTGELVRVIKKNLLFSNYLYHFCFDMNGNFLVSDRDKNCLFILSSDGSLLHSICTKEWGCESPFGVGVTSDGRVVMSFLNGNFSIVIM